MTRHFEPHIILAEVKENQLKLEACKHHDFQPITPGLFGTRYKCYACGGEVDGLSARWYAIGLLHGATDELCPPSGTSG